jgi:hypothetical protein
MYFLGGCHASDMSNGPYRRPQRGDPYARTSAIDSTTQPPRRTHAALNQPASGLPTARANPQASGRRRSSSSRVRRARHPVIQRSVGLERDKCRRGLVAVALLQRLLDRTKLFRGGGAHPNRNPTARRRAGQRKLPTPRVRQNHARIPTTDVAIRVFVGWTCSIWVLG